MKICSACKQLKSFDEFHKRGATRDGLQYRCKQCNLEWQRAKLYNLSPDQVAQMHANQNNRCAICNKTSTKPLQIDHNHVTGKVRGLVCLECNSGLGRFQDNADWLARAASYIRNDGPVAHQ